MRRIVIALAAGLAAGSVLPAAAPAATTSGVCPERTIRNYAKPLERLPQMRSPPLSHLPFGPAHVFLSHPLGGPLVVGSSSEFGYSLLFSPFLPGHRLSPLLGWIVEARYVRVDKQGKAIQAKGHIVRRIRRLQTTSEGVPGHVDFLFRAGEPALYRLEITFTTFSGKRLARYGEYLRVLKPRLDARLTLSGSSFKPGERVAAYLDNYGTTLLSSGLLRLIEYFDGTSWVEAPNSSQGPVPSLLFLVGPGESAECWSFTIPPDEPAGKYRFVAAVSSNKSSAEPRPEPRRFVSEFQIDPPR